MASEETTEQKPSGGNKGLMIALIAVVVLLIATIGVGVWLVMSGAIGGAGAEAAGHGDKNATAAAEQHAPAPEAAHGEGGDAGAFQADINDLVLNITDAKGREKMLKLSFSLKSTEPTIAKVVEENKAEIIDTVIGQISSRSAEELLTVGGKELLKEELLTEANKIINNAVAANHEVQQNSVKKLFFTTFVLK